MAKTMAYVLRLWVIRRFQRLGLLLGISVSDLQLEIKEGELRLHNSNDGIKRGYLLPFTPGYMFQPKAEFDITSFEPVRDES
jgi:hypothetical protein